MTSFCITEIINSVFSYQGIPLRVVSDGGPQFSSKEYSNFCI